MNPETRKNGPGAPPTAPRTVRRRGPVSASAPEYMEGCRLFWRSFFSPLCLLLAAATAKETTTSTSRAAHGRRLYSPHHVQLLAQPVADLPAGTPQRATGTLPVARRARRWRCDSPQVCRCPEARNQTPGDVSDQTLRVGSPQFFLNFAHSVQAPRTPRVPVDDQMGRCWRADYCRATRAAGPSCAAQHLPSVAIREFFTAAQRKCLCPCLACTYPA